ncbi:MAG TPA: acetyl-CoA carboxylase biotin carboxyl carrier protein [Nitrospirales bacterium]|nr:acetyl-CoA carboxylase biotin carboxyl carrier protein [Nitrospirales bacterium]
MAKRSKPAARPPQKPSGAVAKQPEALAGRDAIEAVIGLLQQHNLAEIEIERQGVRIRVRRDLAPEVVAVAASGPARHAAPSQESQEGVPAATVPDATGKVIVKSPIVGTFYRSPSPDADPYIEEGDTVRKGQVLCIVEAMKLMNEIESEVDGRVVKILAESTKPVEYGQPLFLIDPSPASA